MISNQRLDEDSQNNHFPDDADYIRLHRVSASLTTIRGLAQMLGRRAERFEGLDDDQRTWLLRCGAGIDEAVTSLLEQLNVLMTDAPLAKKHKTDMTNEA
jgi:hypothetical protein